MTEQEENIQRVAHLTMLSHNYDICDKVNNTTLGVIVGVFSGLIIEIFMNQNYEWQNIVFMVLCIIATILLIVAIHLNNEFKEKCNMKIREQTSYETPIKIKELVNEEFPNIRKKFYIFFMLSFVFIIVGICLFILVEKNNIPYHSLPKVKVECLFDSLKL